MNISYSLFSHKISFFYPSILGNDLDEIISVKLQPLLKRFLRASLGRTDDETSMKLTLVPGSIPSSAVFNFQFVQTILQVRCSLGKNKYSAVDVMHCIYYLETYHASAESLYLHLNALKGAINSNKSHLISSNQY